MRTGLETTQSEVIRFRKNNFGIVQQPAWATFWSITLREGESVQLSGVIVINRGSGASLTTMNANFTAVGQKPTGNPIVAYTPRIMFTGAASPVTQLGWVGSGSTLSLQLRDTDGTIATHVAMEYTINRRIPS